MDTVHYLDSEAPLKSFLAEIAHAKEVAVDTEGASFHKFVDRIYLLQLSARGGGGGNHAIIDPLRFTRKSRDPEHLEDTVQPLSALGFLLQDRSVEVVFHDADYDLRLLHQDYGWNVTNIFDTRISAQLLGLKQVGLAALLEDYFNVKLDKKHQRADWSMRPLSQDMLDYAAQDTRHLLDLKDILKEELIKAGRWEWATEEFALLEGIRWEPVDESLSYFRIKGARDLSRRELAILRELVPWRDSVAKELDRATFRVMANWALLDVAAKQPKTIAELSKIRGTPKGMLDRVGNDILAAVQRGLDVPEDELPKYPKGQRYDRDPDFETKVDRGRAVREKIAAELYLDPGFLFSREKLEAVVRHKPQTLDEFAEVPGVRRWQADVLGADIIKALNKP